MKALDALMDIAEAGGTDAAAVKEVLVIFTHPSKHALDFDLLKSLTPSSWEHVLTALNMIRLTNGVYPYDFKDDGDRLKRILEDAGG